MTGPFAGARRIPGSADGSRAGYVLHRADLVYEVISDLNKNPHDEGFVHRLADRDLTGDPDCEFAVGVYRMAPGMRHPAHLHASSAEFYYVLSGTALFTIGAESFTAGAGTAMYIPPGTPHAISTDESEMELIYSFHVPDLAGIGTVWLDEPGPR